MEYQIYVLCEGFYVFFFINVSVPTRRCQVMGLFQDHMKNKSVWHKYYIWPTFLSTICNINTFSMYIIYMQTWLNRFFYSSFSQKRLTCSRCIGLLHLSIVSALYGWICLGLYTPKSLQFLLLLVKLSWY